MRDKKLIAIAEDHTILREGLRSLLSASDDIDVIGEAKDGVEAILLVEKKRPHLILLDLAMPKMNGIEAVKEIKRRFPEVKVLVLTVHKTEEYIIEAFKAGAEGYCIKDATHTELMMAIRSILDGKRYLSPEISEKVLEGYFEDSKILKSTSLWDTITQREREILKLVGEGYTNKRIADYLCISSKTVEKHKANIMAKLDLHNASALASYAINKSLIEKN